MFGVRFGSSTSSSNYPLENHGVDRRQPNLWRPLKVATLPIHQLNGRFWKNAESACAAAAGIPGAPSERQLYLHFQPAIVGVFRKAFPIHRTRHLIGSSEQRRRDVADDGAGVGVIEDISGG